MIYALIFICADWVFAAAFNENMLRNRIEELERQGYLGKTVSLYEDLLQYHPTDPELAHGLARALKAKEDYVELVRHLKKWVKSNSKDELAVLMLGEAYLDLGEINKAIQAWNALISSQHASLGTYRKLSNRCESAGFFREAISFLEKGRKANGSKKLFVWELAKLRMRVGDIRESVELYLTFLDENPNSYSIVESELSASCRLDNGQLLDLLGRKSKQKKNLSLVRIVGQCALSMDRPREGFIFISDYVDNSGNPEILYQYSDECERDGLIETAAEFYSYFANNFKESVLASKALQRSIQIRLNHGEIRLALSDLETLIDMAPDEIEVHQLVIQIARSNYIDTDHSEKMISMLESIIPSMNQGPLVGKTLSLLVDYALKDGRLDDADLYIRRMQEIENVDEYELGVRRAELAYFTSDCSEVISFVKPLIEYRVDHLLSNDAIEMKMICEELGNELYWADIIRAKLLERQNFFEKSESIWLRLFSELPAYTKERLMLIRAQAAKGSSRALKFFTQLIEEFPESVFAVEGKLALADLHQDSGRFKEALNIYKNGLMMAPNGFLAADFRLRIERLRKEILQREVKQ